MSLKSFTMAEILITLGIIGIIAALTIPQVITGYQKKVSAIQTKAAYSVLYQAILRAEEDFGEIKDWDFTNSKKILFEYIGTYLNKQQTVSVTDWDRTHSMCDKMKLFNTYKFLDGTGAGDPFQLEAPSIQLYSGACLGLNRANNTNPQETILFIDSNGPQKAPNTFGKDLYMFILTKTDKRKLVPNGYNARHPENLTNANIVGACNKSAKFGGRYCSIILMENNWEFPKTYPW